MKLLDHTHLRVGNAEYVKANKSFGLSTLCDRHVSFTSGSVRVQFRGKSGVRHERKVSDKRLARVVRSCRDLPGQHLFQYRTPDNEVRKIGSADVNAYIRRRGRGLVHREGLPHLGGHGRRASNWQGICRRRNREPPPKRRSWASSKAWQRCWVTRRRCAVRVTSTRAYWKSLPPARSFTRDSGPGCRPRRAGCSTC